jgi:hypothetical protein
LELMPQHLYHYTTIETLALILKSKKMRFNSLINVDDLEEAKSIGISNYGMHSLVACFTNDSIESIPIWNMYSNNGAGVRMKLKNPLFEKFSINIIDKMCSVIFDGKAFPVIYTDDNDKLYPQILRVFNGETMINGEDNGKYKRTNWEFQNEWRFKIHIYRNNGEIGMIAPGVLPPINYYDANLLDDVINNSCITLGYNISHGNRLIVEMLVDKYNETNNSNIIIEESKFNNLIKPKY